MTVVQFDIEKGIYIFEFDELRTEIHSHPAVEILYTNKGYFTLSTNNSDHHHLTFAVIDANIQHSITANNCSLQTVMLEHNPNLIQEILFQYNITLKEGFYWQKDSRCWHEDIKEITKKISEIEKGQGYDQRVTRVIKYLENQSVEYSVMIKTLKQLVNLSESRLSHLFKENTGITLKKYLVWSKLKTTIANHLNEKEDLFTSLIHSGFYDQPHFSRAFKVMLGVPPSKAYNSRMLQA